MLMCVFEVLHFLPLALIALSALGLKSKFNGLFAVMVLFLSIAGLVAGDHAHSEHGSFFGVIDPCFGYMVAIALSGFSILKSLKSKLAKVNA